jgi:hypothetical protein
MGGMHDMSAMSGLTNATGAEFSRMWVSQMTTMHRAKLSELQAASRTIKEAELLALVNRSIPKIQSHLTMLTRANASGTGNTNTQQ